MASTFTLQANYIDILQKEIYPIELHVVDGLIARIKRMASDLALPYILPGFVDAHVHIESSMLLPSEFGRLAVVHGTVGTVSDPHEIGNVLGVKGVDYMLQNAAQSPFYCCFGAPSCVPATNFETAGASISAAEVEELLQRDDIYYLTEMMNFPGVLNDDAEVMKKIAHAKRLQKPVDGHAPGLRGEAAKKYIDAGISTDHECFTKDEAVDKLGAGMKILIREGSAAKNFNELVDLIDEFPNEIMLCSDDKHPDSLVASHINQLVIRALAKGKNLFHVLQAACINPVLHYHLPIGLMKETDSADFILIDSPATFTVLKTYIKGEVVAENGKSKLPFIATPIINQFNCEAITESAIQLLAKGNQLKVIEALNGQLITNSLIETPTIKDGLLMTNTEKDILKIVCFNRYHSAKPAIAFIKNFGFKKGAIASTVAHDSHNIVAIGVDDKSIVKVINELIKLRGGIAVTDGQSISSLALPIAGLMSNEDGYTVAHSYSQLDQAAKNLGSQLDAPFMTLSFMALLVIPSLKLSDLGLFDGEQFKFTAVN
jgi:adenine deaminase